jgi:hypothetical protein
MGAILQNDMLSLSLSLSAVNEVWVCGLRRSSSNYIPRAQTTPFL